MKNVQDRLRQTLIKYHDLNAKYKGGEYIDSYNKKIYFNGLCGTINTGVDSKNHSYVTILVKR